MIKRKVMMIWVKIIVIDWDCSSWEWFKEWSIDTCCGKRSCKSQSCVMKPHSLVFGKWLGKWLDYYHKYHSHDSSYVLSCDSNCPVFIPHYLFYVGINPLVNRYFTENTFKPLWLSPIISNKIDPHSFNTVRSMITVAYFSSSYISSL